ncbi:hypothetical protein CK203_026205 [Vitis vinifera]|uniref:Uncharacterized protein n=1 Tax=Vitis vinifera TaxID=29760 RepID=A0A438IL89_VITVI|nr:hypothetical protein CK203_026205 [Vitis vinifera]
MTFSSKSLFLLFAFALVLVLFISFQVCALAGEAIKSSAAADYGKHILGHDDSCPSEGHTEERCRFKNDTWVPNNIRTQGNRQSQPHQQQRRVFVDQLQQLARAVSMMIPNQASGNRNAYANATGLDQGEGD